MFRGEACLARQLNLGTPEFKSYTRRFPFPATDKATGVNIGLTRLIRQLTRVASLPIPPQWRNAVEKLPPIAANLPPKSPQLAVIGRVLASGANNFADRASQLFS